MRVLAPAKINLHLRVGPRRGDGFHSLLSWFATVGLFDNLVLEGQSPQPHLFPFEKGAEQEAVRAPGESRRQAASISLQCDLPGLPCDERNLVVRIALGFANELGAGCIPPAQGRAETLSDSLRRLQGEVTPVRVMLQKRIPMGAGLGGGSSDAARTLLGLNQLWGCGRAADVLSAFAARFGSDLSFFFHGPSSICRGRGEIVTPIGKPKPRWAVLILPEVVMPTADVYRRFDTMGLGREADLNDAPNWTQWTMLNSRELLERLVNDLEPAAFAISPELCELRSRHERMLGRTVRMSGSGSSFFTLFDEEPEANDASIWLEKTFNVRAPAVELSPNFRDDLNTKQEVM